MQPDLDSPERIHAFVDAFYALVLADPVLAPIFLDVAAVDLARHLPHIRAYWEKLVLGREGYHRHTMNIHRALHAKKALAPAEFARWLELFEQALDAGYAGPRAERARAIARAIAKNMQAAL